MRPTATSGGRDPLRRERRERDVLWTARRAERFRTPLCMCRTCDRRRGQQLRHRCVQRRHRPPSRTDRADVVPAVPHQLRARRKRTIRSHRSALVARDCRRDYRRPSHPPCARMEWGTGDDARHRQRGHISRVRSRQFSRICRSQQTRSHVSGFKGFHADSANRRTLTSPDRSSRQHSLSKPLEQNSGNTGTGRRTGARLLWRHPPLRTRFPFRRVGTIAARYVGRIAGDGTGLDIDVTPSWYDLDVGNRPNPSAGSASTRQARSST